MIFKQGSTNGIGVDTASAPSAVFDGKWIPWHIEIYNGLPYWEAWFLSSGTLSVTGKFDAQAWGIGGGGFPNRTEQNGYNPLGGRGSTSVVSVTLEGDVAVTIGEGAKNGASPGGNTMIGNTVVGAGGQPATPGTGAPYRFADPDKAGEAGETQSNNSFGYGEGGWLHWDGSESHYNGRGYGAAGGIGNASGYCAAHEGALVIRVPIQVGAEYMGTTSGASSVRVDTSDATAVAGDLLRGKIAYAGGQRLTGAMSELDAQTITPNTSDQTIAAGQYLAGEQTIKGDINLLPKNIAYGVNLFGVEGSLLGGALKTATGSQTIGTGSNVSITVTGLDFDPMVVVLYDSSSVGFGCDQYAIVRIQNGQSQATFTHTDGSFTLTLGNLIISSRTYTWYAYGM